jgi:maleylacetoacetate isomerase/maleylpyruvate isomerase
MILHDFALSSASYRVRIALNLKGLDYETRSYRLRAGEQRGADYLAINPAGLVPTLEIDGRILTQSLAIIDYLDATRVVPRLIPVDPAERARVLAIAFTIACDIHPLNNLRVLQYLETVMAQDGTARDAWYRTWISSGFAAIEAELHKAPETPFVAGDAPGIAEVCLVPQVFNARRFKIELESFPRLVQIADRAGSLAAFAKAAPP